MLKNIIRRVIYLVAMLAITNVAAYGQTPVQVNPQLLPPYSLQVSDYYSGLVPKLQVLLLNRDINQPTIQVKLRMTIESQNCKLRTKDNAVTPTFTLTSGIPYYLTPQDLQALFAPANLDFLGGYSEQAYTQTGRLPEGLYTFTIEANELYTGNLVSNKGFSMAWLTLADPPFLNTPSKAEGVTPATPQQIVFTWTPRHQASPTAAYLTTYIFSIVEDNSGGTNPEAAFASNPPLYVDSVLTTTYLYDAAKPQLIPGKNYAWRIQAVNKNGAQNLAMFRNNGISEAFWFTYQNNCPVPTGITATVQGLRSTIEWQNNPVYLDYKVEYREKNNPDAQWFSINNTLPRVMLTDLKPSTQYEYRVGGSCREGAYTYSTLQSFTTTGTAVSMVPNCGDSTTYPAGGGVLQTLVAGDTIKAGSFTVNIGYVTGVGSFTGTGYVRVPWLMNAKVEVRFTNITVSLDKKLKTGIIETTYDPTESGIADIDEYIDVFTGGTDVGHVLLGTDTTKYTVPFDIPDPTPPLIFTPSGSGGGTMTFPGGQTLTVDVVPTTIKDAHGDIYTATKDSSTVPPTIKITKIGNAGGAAIFAAANKHNLDLNKGRVDFAAANDMIYAFDAWNDAYENESKWNNKYEKFGEYHVSAKAIAPGKADKVLARISFKDSTLRPDSLMFVNGKGTVYEKKKMTDSLYELTITGGPGGDAQEVYALYPQASGTPLNLGKLLVASYEIQNRKVILVPVNGALVNKDSIVNVLKRVYGKLCVNWEVIKADNFNNTDWDVTVKDGKLQVDGSGTWNVLTEEMKALNSAYKLKIGSAIDKNASYLFVLNQAATKTNGVDIFGDMPRAKQFGYLFTGGGAGDNLGSTAAHELGHGVFHLKHTFEYYFSQGSLDPSNVMDYPSGEYLTKFQWDLVHDPGIVVGLFEKDADAMSLTFNNIHEFNPYRNAVDNSYTFIAPSGKYITLPPTIKSASFSTIDRLFFKDKNGAVNNETPSDDVVSLGALLSFVDKDDNAFNADFSGAVFNGFKKANSAEIYKDNLSPVIKPLNGIAVFVGVKQNKFMAYASKFKSAATSQNFGQNYTAAGNFLKDFAVVKLNEVDSAKTIATILNENKDYARPLSELSTGTLYFANDNVLFYYPVQNSGTSKGAQDFLLSVLTENSPIKDYVSYFSLVNIKKEELKAFADCLGAAFTLDMQKIQSAVANARIGDHLGYSDANALYSRNNVKTLEQLVSLAGNDINAVTQLKNAVAGKSSAEISAILKANYKVCALPGLDIQTRLYILNKFLTGNYNNDDWYSDPTWYSSNDGHFYVKDLICTTPAQDRVLLLLEFKKNNYEWLRTLWTQANKWLNGVGYYEVHSIFNKIQPWVAENFSSLNITQPSKLIDAGGWAINGILRQDPNDFNFIIGFDGDGIQKSGSKDFEYFTGIADPTPIAELQNNGLIKFYEGYSVKDTKPVFNSQNSTYYPYTNFTFDEEIEPFALISCTVANNYHEKGLDAGDKFVVPAFMVMTLKNDISRTVTERNITVVADAAQTVLYTASAVASGGAALPLILASAGTVTSAADLFIQNEAKNLASNDPAIQYYEAWGKIKLAVDMTNMFYGIYGAAKTGWNAINSYEKIAFTYNSVKNTLNGLPAVVAGQVDKFKSLRTGWANFKNISPAGILPGNVSANLVEGSNIWKGGSSAFINSFDEVAKCGPLNFVKPPFTGGQFNLLKDPGGAIQDAVQVFTKTIPPTSAGPNATAVAAVLDEISTEAAHETMLAVTSQGKFIEIPTKQNLTIKFAQVDEQLLTNYSEFAQTASTKVYKLATSTAAAEPDLVTITLTGTSTLTKVLYASQQAAQVLYDTKIKNNQCTECTRFASSAALCQKFATLKTRIGALYAQAVYKLCHNLNILQVNQVMDYLLSMPQQKLETFASDINPTMPYPQSDYYVSTPKNIEDFSVNIIQAWERMNANKSTGFRKDMLGIVALNNLVNSTALTALGGSEGVNTILQKNERLPCKTCGTTTASYLQPMDEYLKDVKYFAQNYPVATYPGADKVLGPQGIKNSGKNQVEATAFILRVLSANPNLKNQITSFEEKIEVIDDEGNTNKVFADIKQEGNIIVECKSWFANGMAFQNFIQGQGSYSQFKTYLASADVDNLSKIEYWFDSKKITEQEAKNNFKKLLYNSTTNTLTTQGDEIFNIIWSNTGLRASVFSGDGIDFTLADAIIRPIGLAKFREKVANVASNSMFYNFIKVK